MVRYIFTVTAFFMVCTACTFDKESSSGVQSVQTELNPPKPLESKSIKVEICRALFAKAQLDITDADSFANKCLENDFFITHEIRSERPFAGILTMMKIKFSAEALGHGMKDCQTTIKRSPVHIDEDGDLHFDEEKPWLAVDPNCAEHDGSLAQLVLADGAPDLPKTSLYKVENCTGCTLEFVTIKFGHIIRKFFEDQERSVEDQANTLNVVLPTIMEDLAANWRNEDGDGPWSNEQLSALDGLVTPNLENMGMAKVTMTTTNLTGNSVDEYYLINNRATNQLIVVLKHRSSL